MEPFLDTVRKHWIGSEIRGLILLSLFLQIILIIFGSLRKKIAKGWIRILVWSAYMSADWVATVALGILAKKSGDFENFSSESNNIILAFWAPFLLLHLGGPDAITAYSLEDNDLWLRHFLGLIIQVGVAFYVFLLSLSDNALTFLAIPVFVTGIIKYGERTWVLRSSSTKPFRDSLPTEPYAGPGDDNKDEETSTSASRQVNAPNGPGDDDNDVLLAGHLFKSFKKFYADLILRNKERTDCYNIIKDKSPEQAFKLIAVELGYMYDVLYTKATIAYSRVGITLRVISFLCSMSVLVGFALNIDKHEYMSIDITITYMLLIGALSLDIYGFILLTFSDWTMLWLKKSLFNSTSDDPRGFLSDFTNRKRWSGSMAQYSLINSCLKPAKCVAVRKLFCIHETLEKHLYRTWKDIDSALIGLIFEQLLEKGNSIEQDNSKIEKCKQLMAQRGDSVLKEKGLDDQFGWCTTDVEFDHSFLLWHIATDLCYYEKPENDVHRRISKGLSDYMVYLLVLCPSMLPKGIGEIRYRDTRAEAKRFFKQRRIVIAHDPVEACKALLQVKITSLLETVKGDRTQSVLFNGCKLAHQLKSLEEKEGWESKRRWEMISQVWVELLTYAASRCEWKEHGQQLRRGGELLTHVSVLMIHLGLSEQYQIQ